MQFTTTLIASILAVAAAAAPNAAAPNAAAAADVEKRQLAECALRCVTVIPFSRCIANGVATGDINAVLQCGFGDSSLLCRCVDCVEGLPSTEALQLLLDSNNVCNSNTA